MTGNYVVHKKVFFISFALNGNSGISNDQIGSSSHRIISFRPLIDPVVNRTIGLIKRSGRDLSYDAQKLYDLLMEKFKK